MYLICHTRREGSCMSTIAYSISEGSTPYGRLCQLYPEISFRSTMVSSTIPVACPMPKGSSLRMETLHLVNRGSRSSSEIRWTCALWMLLKALASCKERPVHFWLRVREEDEERLVLRLPRR